MQEGEARFRGLFCQRFRFHSQVSVFMAVPFFIFRKPVNPVDFVMLFIVFICVSGAGPLPNEIFFCSGLEILKTKIFKKERSRNHE